MNVFVSPFGLRILCLFSILALSHCAHSQPLPSTQHAPPARGQADQIATETRIQVAAMLLEERPVGDYVESANRLLYDGAWDQAMIQYLIAERIKPGNFHARYQLARIFSKLGQPELCTRWLREAVDYGFFQYALAHTDPSLIAVLKEKPELLETVRTRYQANLSKHVVVVPPAGEPPAAGWPVVLLMHGYGRSATYFKYVADNAAANGFLGVAIDGPMPWTTHEEKAYGWPDDNVEGNHVYLQDVLKLTVTQKYDPKRVYVGGFSQGGLQAAILLANYPDSYAGGLVISPGGWAHLPPNVTSPKVRRPMFLLVGEQEETGNKALVLKCERLWREVNLPVRSTTHPEAHRIPQDWQTRSPAIYQWLLESAK